MINWFEKSSEVLFEVFGRFRKLHSNYLIGNVWTVFGTKIITPFITVTKFSNLIGYISAGPLSLIGQFVIGQFLIGKKGHSLQLFCFYIPVNYAIPQVMPHAIPQNHSAFYPHGFVIGHFMRHARVIGQYASFARTTTGHTPGEVPTKDVWVGRCGWPGALKH